MKQAPLPTRDKPKSYRGKRAFDLAIAIPALLVSSPVMLVVALLVRWRLGRPVLFRQVRPGLQGQAFTMYKFRTMRETRDESGALLPDRLRLTSLGKTLRATSLDELPELVNVIRGDMSLVGPRPLLDRYMQFYTSIERERFKVRPGITGLSQVTGRNALAWDDRLATDVWYVHNISWWLDLKILTLTIVRVVRRSDVHTVTDLTLQDLDEERRHCGIP